MREQLQELLDELSDLVHTPLYADTVDTCHILINKKLHVQIKIDKGEDKLLIASVLCPLPPGKFRENVLFEALRDNSIFPRIGSFGYSERHNQLVLFAYLPLEKLNGKELYTYLSLFTDRGILWKNAIENGESAPLEIKQQWEAKGFLKKS